MTQTKGNKRVNLHLLPNVHARLKAWCYRNGLSLQDGLATMVDLCARETNGLRIPGIKEPAPFTLERPIEHATPATAQMATAPEPSKPKEMSQQQKDMRDRALGDDFESQDDHKEYLGKALRFCVITREQHDAKLLDIEQGPMI
jgi:hypothetical protein